MKRNHLNQHGFSLVELLAILVILAISTSLALPSFGNSLRKTQFKKDGRLLMAQLRHFKLQAITEGKPLHISYEKPQFHVLTQGDIEASLKPLEINDDTTLTLSPEELYFSPQGWARPATLTLTRGNLSQTIIIDPLTGRPYKKQRGTTS